MKTLCFRLYGDFGHFRKYFTTTSPITYSIIPPTAAMGVIGAILGLERKDNSYYNILQNAKTRIGIGIQGGVKKRSFGINLINTKGDYWVPTRRNPNGSRTPTRYEFIVKPDYLIFVSMEDKELLEDLAMSIKEHRSVYNICMGLAWLLADFQFICFKEAEILNDIKEHLPLSSAVPVSLLHPTDGIKLIDGVNYCKERFVKCFGDNRIPQDYVDAIFPINGQKAFLKLKEVYKLDDYYFVFLT